MGQGGREGGRNDAKCHTRIADEIMAKDHSVYRSGRGGDVDGEMK